MRKIANGLEMVNCGAKRTEHWDSGVLNCRINVYMLHIWPCSGQGNFRVIRCTFLKMACNSKMSVERNGMKFGTRGY